MFEQGKDLPILISKENRHPIIIKITQRSNRPEARSYILLKGLQNMLYIFW